MGSYLNIVADRVLGRVKSGIQPRTPSLFEPPLPGLSARFSLAPSTPHLDNHTSLDSTIEEAPAAVAVTKPQVEALPTPAANIANTPSPHASIPTQPRRSDRGRNNSAFHLDLPPASGKGKHEESDSASPRASRDITPRAKPTAEAEGSVSPAKADAPLHRPKLKSRYCAIHAKPHLSTYLRGRRPIRRTSPM